MTLEKILEELGFKKSEYFKNNWIYDSSFRMSVEVNEDGRVTHFAILNDASDSYMQFIRYKNLVELQNKLLKAEQNARYMLGVGESE